MARKKVRKAGGRAQAQRQQVHLQQMQRQQMSGEQLERQQIERERAKRQQEGQRREQLLMQQRREMQQRQEMLRQRQMYGDPGQEEGKRKKKARRFYDYDLLVVIIFLTVFGLIMIYSSSAYNAQVSRQPSNYYMVRQGQIAVAGFILMLIISKIDYHFFAKITVPAVVVSYICEILVTFTPLGIAVNGKKRWLGTRSLRFQPAELVKIVVILLLAVLITRLGKQINEWRVWGMIAVLIGPLALLVTMNNLSSGIIICGIAFVMMFIACKRKWPFIATVVLGITVIVHVILFLPYETKEMMFHTIDHLNKLDIQGIKLQLLHILKGTDLAAVYEKTHFHVPDMEEYIELLGSCIAKLRPDIIVHRLTGDGPKELLIAPLWTSAKRTVLNRFHQYLKQQDIWQGKDYHV